MESQRKVKNSTDVVSKTTLNKFAYSLKLIKMSKPIFFTGVRSFTWNPNKKYPEWRPDLKLYIKLEDYDTDKHQAHFCVMCTLCWEENGDTVPYPTWNATARWWYDFCQELEHEIEFDDPGGAN